MKYTTPQTDKATARPWLFDDRHIHPASGLTYPRGVEPETDVIVCVDTDCHVNGLLNETDRHNLALIVRAVNEHSALVAVAEAHAALLSHVTNFQQWIREGKSSGELFVNLDTSRDKQALANLAAVRGGK